MKGLLIKDFYMTVKYCRTYMLILLAFIGASCFSSNQVFFLFYPSLLAGLVPVTLISYDEREKWNVYAMTLPCSKTEIVTSKYLMGLFFELIILVLSGAAQAVRMVIGGSFDSVQYLSLLVAMFFIGLLAPSLLLPFIFKFGVEKGRIAYYILIVGICVAATLLVGSGFNFSMYLSAVWTLVVIAVAAVLIFTISWLLSVALYKKREL